MKFRTIFTAAIAAAALTAAAQTPWLHIYYPKDSNFKSMKMESLDSLRFDQEKGTMILGDESIKMSDINRFVVGRNVPRIDITTTEANYPEEFGYQYYGSPITEVVSKEIYLEATLKFDGQGIYDDVETPVLVRGRGNSTWGYPKKAYRLKFPEKTKLGNVHKSKNLCLLANYIDPTAMKNFAAFQFGKLIDMPYINRSLPCDVYFNGIYKGTYQLTEKVGINNGSVDLTKEDAANSVMFEMDTNPFTQEEMEQGMSFTDEHFGIPMIIKDPDAPEDENERFEWSNAWFEDLEELLEAVSAGESDKRIFELCDIESLVRFVMTFNIACNQELCHPKSINIHKTKGGKWEFGPCWDFDWAYGYQPTYKKGSSNSGGDWGGWGGWGENYPSYENPLIGTGNFQNKGGNLFFLALVKTDTFKKRFNELWKEFRDTHEDEFWEAFDAYAEQVEPSVALQGTTNSSYREFSTHMKDLRTWIKNRFDYISSDPNHGLYEDN